MVDLSMCRGLSCTVKTQCYRHTATRSVDQAWLQPEHERGICLDFIPKPGANHLLIERMRSEAITKEDVLDTSKPLAGSSLTQEEFDLIKSNVRNYLISSSWKKKGEGHE
jgi:hypothetical protein